jgi:hypothetical protein
MFCGTIKLRPTLRAFLQPQLDAIFDERFRSLDFDAWQNAILPGHAMNFTFLKALLAPVPAGTLLSGSLMLFYREEALGAF